MSDLATIEDRLRRTYQAVADTTAVTRHELPDPTADMRVVDGDRWDLPGPSRPGASDGNGRAHLGLAGLDDVAELGDRAGRGRLDRRRFVLAAAVVMGVAALGVAAVVAGGGTDAPTTRAGPAFAPGWSSIAEAPIEGRSLHTVVWTGHELVVGGGYRTEGWYDGATFDPLTQTWEALPDAPTELRSGAQLVTGAGDAGGRLVFLDVGDPEGARWCSTRSRGRGPAVRSARAAPTRAPPWLRPSRPVTWC
jgi:hypothetical protein